MLGFEEFKKVVLRMGGFRTGIRMLRTIYEELDKCGISAADLVGKGTI